MTETYVAVVGASGAILGTLVGALAAGVMARKTARDQADRTNLSQIRELQEQHRVRHREISRTAYSEFIEQTDVAMHALYDLSYYKVEDVDALLTKADTANEAMGAVKKNVTVVQLEGEISAAHAAEEYRTSLEEVLTTLGAEDMMLRAAATSTSIEQLASARVQQVFNNAKRRREEFIARARRALGNDSI
ncbi:hypothetical protein [Streptomyces sp. NPDC004629]|uniref:hypothetical protein n=1 Tax=Streptomyces sp. NPDC004629 TaxID=3364705 RepID=UPI003686B471